MNETITILEFLQQNASWICGFGMLVFAAVQVWLMFAQNRQQLRLKRLELVQQLDEVAFEFDGTREKTIKVQEWMAKHQSVCALLLRKKMLERQIVSLDSNVDELVYELYELSEKEINFVESAMKSME